MLLLSCYIACLPQLFALQKILGVPFNDLSLLQLAVVHSSYVNENPGFGSVHNERLEFLGDAVLQLVISDYLIRNFTDVDEGELSKYVGYGEGGVLTEAVRQDRHRETAPIGFYFAKLWYHERLYPLTFTVAALGQAIRCLDPGPKPSLAPPAHGNAESAG